MSVTVDLTAFDPRTLIGTGRVGLLERTGTYDVDRYAWAYGTLPIHPEVGEERFAIVRRGDTVWFEVSAFSKVVDPFGRLVPWFARGQQVKANRAYLDAMVASQRSSL